MVDATNKPLRIPAEYAIYADKHEIFDLMMQLFQCLVINRPKDPLTYLINLLKCKDFDLFTVMIIGPPCSGKHSLAELLCRICPNLHLVDPIPVIRNYLAQEAKKVPKSMQTEQPKRYKVRPDLAAKAIAQYLNKNECFQRSWVMPGFPRNKSQAIELAINGIYPERAIRLDVSDAKVFERFGKKYPEYKEFVSPECTSSYRQTTEQTTPVTDTLDSGGQIMTGIKGINPSVITPVMKKFECFDTAQPSSTKIDMNQKYAVLIPPSSKASVKTYPLAVQKFHRILYNYRRNAKGMCEFYGKRCRYICGEPSLEIVLNSVVEDLRTKSPSLAPFNPRILLFGPPASGKRTIASSLAVKYDLVNLHGGELIRQYKVSRDLDGKATSDLKKLNDSLALNIITKRLLQVDCVTSGWILRGFPRTKNQARLFRKENFHPNKVIFLDVPDNLCLARILPRRIDPVTGFVYHSSMNVPLDPEIIARLVVHPRDKEDRVRTRLRRYRAIAPFLTEFYPLAQHVDASRPIFTAFELVESILIRPNPRNLVIPDDLFPRTPSPLSIKSESSVASVVNFHLNPLDVDFVDYWSS